MSKVVVVGLGYVGLPLAVQAAESGHDVLGVDVDTRKLALLRSGTSHVEDVSNEQLRRAIEGGYLNIAHNVEVSSFDIGIITVPTPLKERAPDLSYVEAAARTLGRNLKPGSAVVLESTTYPGTTEGLVARAIYEESGLTPAEYHLGFSPERIDPGNKHNDFHNTAKIVSGLGEEALAVIDNFYKSVVVETIQVSSPRVAEMAKLMENMFRHVNIALVNELAVISHELGVNLWEALDAAATKPYGFMKFTPGPGVGGHCIPIDPLYMTWRSRSESGISFRLGELAQDINDSMPGYVVQRAGAILNEQAKSVKGSRLLVVGAAYKPGIGDLRESPALPIIHKLEALGADVTVTDPHLPDWNQTRYLELEDLVPALPNYDLVIVVTHHPEYDYAKIAKLAPMVLDCRNVVPAAPNVERL